MNINTRTYYEQNLEHPSAIPNPQGVITFLNNQAQELEANPERVERNSVKFVRSYAGTVDKTCKVCNKINHRTNDCFKFDGKRKVLLFEL